MMENSKQGETNASEISVLLSSSGSSQSKWKPSIVTKCIESDDKKLWRRLKM